MQKPVRSKSAPLSRDPYPRFWMPTLSEFESNKAVASRDVSGLHPSYEYEGWDRTRSAVDQAGPIGLDVATLDERAREALTVLDGVVVQAGRARAAAAADPLESHPFLSALASSPFAPPEPTGVDRAELRELVKRGLVVERDGVWFVAGAVNAAAQVVAGMLAGAPDGFTVAQARDALGCTRKYALPLLAELDARGVTRRRGDVRIAGPRLPVSPPA